MYRFYGFNQGMGFPFGWVFALIIVVLLGVAVYLIARKGKKGQAGDTSIEILKARFAKGEISEEEYRSRLTTLKG
jgi:putative membrane protein